MDNIAKKEQLKYQDMWQLPHHKVVSDSNLLANIFLTYFEKKITKEDKLLDLGCGDGLSTLQFLEAKLNVVLFDIASNALQDKIRILTLFMPQRVQFVTGTLWAIPEDIEPSWIYCVDVLEHIPPEKIDLSMENIYKKTKKGGLLQISLTEMYNGANGDKLHMLVRSKEWWIKKIQNYWKIEQLVYRKDGQGFLCLFSSKI